MKVNKKHTTTRQLLHLQHTANGMAEALATKAAKQPLKIPSQYKVTPVWLAKDRFTKFVFRALFSSRGALPCPEKISV